jgi:hypothetical protein
MRTGKVELKKEKKRSKRRRGDFKCLSRHLTIQNSRDVSSGTRTDMALTDKMLKNRINGAPDKSRLILEIFRSHNEKMAQLVGSDFALGTLGRYETTFDHTKAFIEWKYKMSDVSIQALDFDFISDSENEFLPKGNWRCLPDKQSDNFPFD